MKERPLLMSGPNVLSILAGLKTHTRRVVKGEPLSWLDDHGFSPDFVVSAENGLCPYGQPGDRLWVRENYWKCELHRADTGEATGHYVAMFDRQPYNIEGKPAGRKVASIHMPRWASRVLLEVVSVRIERLQDISEEDAQAEGVVVPEAVRGVNGYIPGPYSFKRSFEFLWDSINSKPLRGRKQKLVGPFGGHYEYMNPKSWGANPWVWVIEFKQVLPALQPEVPLGV